MKCRGGGGGDRENGGVRLAPSSSMRTILSLWDQPKKEQSEKKGKG